MKIAILPEAEGDIEDIATFYDEQEDGLGTEVYGFLREKIDGLALTAGMHRIRGRLHAMVVLGRFPYFLVMYRMADQTAEVCAVIDCRRDPEWNSSLLGKR